jgi:hypothetical protein
MTANEFHRIAGHNNERALHQRALHYNIILQGKLSPCVFCALENLHQTPITHDPVPRSTIPGERIFIDITKLTHPSMGGNKFWLIAVDDATNYLWSFFLKAKSDTTPRLLPRDAGSWYFCTSHTL